MPSVNRDTFGCDHLVNLVFHQKPPRSGFDCALVEKSYSYAFSVVRLELLRLSSGSTSNLNTILSGSQDYSSALQNRLSEGATSSRVVPLFQ